MLLHSLPGNTRPLLASCKWAEFVAETSDSKEVSEPTQSHLLQSNLSHQERNVYLFHTIIVGTKNVLVLRLQAPEGGNLLLPSAIRILVNFNLYT